METIKTKYNLHQRKRITEKGCVEYDFVWATEDGELLSPVFGTMDKAASYPMLNAMFPTGKRLEDLDILSNDPSEPSNPK